MSDHIDHLAALGGIRLDGEERERLRVGLAALQSLIEALPAAQEEPASASRAPDLTLRADEPGVSLPADVALAELIGDAATRHRSVAGARILLDEARSGDLESVLLAHPAGEDESIDEALLRRLVESHPGKVEQYRAGKLGLIGWFVAEARRQWPQHRDPASLASALRRLLSGDDR